MIYILFIVLSLLRPLFLFFCLLLHHLPSFLHLNFFVSLLLFLFLDFVLLLFLLSKLHSVFLHLLITSLLKLRPFRDRESLLSQ